MSDPAARAWQSGVARLVGRIQGLFPVRVFVNYATAHGPLLASGLAFQGIFATFAAIWLGFSVTGLVFSGNAGFQRVVIDFLAQTVPGLIKDSSGSGAIDPAVLLDSGAFSWTGAIALVGLLVTALGWLGSARSAVRFVFGLPEASGNFLIGKAKDLGLAVGFGLLLIISAVLSVAGSAATGWMLGLIGVSPGSVPGTVVGRIVTLAGMFVLDAGVLFGLFRVLSSIQIPWRRMRAGVLIGAAGLGVLKVLGSSLLGGARHNPLLASFAVIIGLLIFFNFSCQVILISASWIAIEMKDHGSRAIRGAEHEPPAEVPVDPPDVGAAP